MAELDVTILAPATQESSGHLMRSEWDPNANPH